MREAKELKCYISQVHSILVAASEMVNQAIFLCFTIEKIFIGVKSKNEITLNLFVRHASVTA